jgi:hypothetical protein
MYTSSASENGGSVSIAVTMVMRFALQIQRDLAQ